MISALHQRFPDTFTPLFTFQLQKALQPSTRQQLASLTDEQRDKEETTRVSRQRTYMRIAVELWLACVLRNVEDGIPTLASGNLEGVESSHDGVAGFVGSASTKTSRRKDDTPKSTGVFVFAVLRDLLTHDTPHHVNLPIAVSFLKNYSQSVLGIVPRKQRAATAAQNDEEVDAAKAVTTSETVVHGDADSPVTPEVQAMLKTLVVDYATGVQKHLVKFHTNMKKLDHRNRETLFARGELSEETKANYEKVSKMYEKLLNNTQT